MPDHGHGRNLPKTIKFQDTELAIIDRDGVPWLTGPDIARAIGYSRSDEIGRIYRRRKDEFSEAMSCTANLAVHGKASPTRVRVFSPRGAQLIAMFANTTTAKAFRRWVLDVLEAQAAPGAKLPPAEGSSFDHMKVVNDVVTIMMGKIGPMIAANRPREMPPLTKPDDPMPRLIDGHAVFRIGNRMVIVDTHDFRLKRGERAVVLQVEDGEFPKVVTVLDEPPLKTWFDRCMIFDSGVHWHIPVGAVLGRVVWEGECHG